MRLRSLLYIALLVSVASSARGASEIVWHVMGSGGMSGQSATNEVRSTLGQPVVGEATSSSYRIHSGFWLPRGTETGGDDGDITNMPRLYRLGEIAPNPFNGMTRVAFEVPAGGGHVSISVFDVRGAMVRVLVDEQVAAGKKDVLWDGRDSSGRQTASGMYFVRMKAPGYETARKVMFAK